MSPERLWKLSAALRARGHLRLALMVKKINSVIYHNSLAPGASFSPDISFGHHGFGTVIHSNVVIGRRVKIWHNVTIAVRAQSSSPHQIIIDPDRPRSAHRRRRSRGPRRAAGRHGGERTCPRDRGPEARRRTRGRSARRRVAPHARLGEVQAR